jgi:hypothetical protein
MTIAAIERFNQQIELAAVIAWRGGWPCRLLDFCARIGNRKQSRRNLRRGRFFTERQILSRVWNPSGPLPAISAALGEVLPLLEDDVIGLAAVGAAISA